MSDLKYVNILNYVSETPWAILPSKLAVILELLRFRAEGGRLSEEEIQARIGAVAKPQARTAGAIAVLPLFGTIDHRAAMMTEMSGGTSVERFTQDFRQALADPAVGAIVLDVDSPGGSVYGVDELSAEIYKGRSQKPIAAIANSMAASAAYYLASAADSLSVIPSGEVGSIGVLAAHTDMSGAMQAEGLKRTLISAGQYKTEANPFEPLTDEAQAYIQSRVDEYYNAFVSAVARNRGVSIDEVQTGYGQGRMVGAKTAKRLGMVDHVETMDELMTRLARQMGQQQGARAEGEPVRIIVDGVEQVATAFDLPFSKAALDLRRRRLKLAGKR